MNMWRNLLVQACCVICLLVFAGQAQAGLMRSDVDPGLYEAYAQEPMFDSVGCLFVNTSSGWLAGSAVLIAPDWLLTSGHNITGSDNHGGGISEVRFYTGSDIYNTYDTLVYADATYVYPGYYSSASPGTNWDIGLVRLSEPLLGVSPAILYSGVDQLGTHVYMSGYGAPGTWPEGPGSFDGVKRAGENIVDHVGWSTLAIQDQYLLADFGPAGSFTPTLPLEWQSSPGDSGAGWFANIDGTTYLIGINAFTRGNNDLSGAISVSASYDWINDTMEANSPVPEPSSLIIFVSGMLALLPAVRRRRRLPH